MVVLRVGHLATTARLFGDVRARMANIGELGGRGWNLHAFANLYNGFFEAVRAGDGKKGAHEMGARPSGTPTAKAPAEPDARRVARPAAMDAARPAAMPAAMEAARPAARPATMSTGLGGLLGNPPARSTPGAYVVKFDRPVKVGMRFHVIASGGREVQSRVPPRGPGAP